MVIISGVPIFRIFTVCSGQKCDVRMDRQMNKAATICSHFGQHKNYHQYSLFSRALIDMDHFLDEVLRNLL